MKSPLLQCSVYGVLVCVLGALAGCGGSSNTPSSTTAPPPPPSPAAMEGTVQHGQQPIVGATIQLYAASATGYGAPSVPLLSSSSKVYPVVTNASGHFSIAGDFSCPSNSLVYLTATGGSAGTGNNPALTLMTALGSCSALAANGTSVAIMVNELTTVGSVWALAPFMTGASSVGTSASNVPGLTHAFLAVNKLVNTTSGSLSGPALPAGAVLPLAELNTLADILAPCVGSSGSTASGAACGTLFAASAVGPVAPADTIAAVLNIAHNPGQNVASLCALATASAPFQPTLQCAPTLAAWTIAIQYTGGALNLPRAVAVDASGNVWLPNAGNNSVTELDNSGAVQSGSTGFTAGPLNVPSAVALDLAGNAWVANSGNASVTRISAQGGTAKTFTGGGLAIPRSIAIDASGDAWIANFGNSSITEFGADGTALSPAGTGFTGSAIHQPNSIAISPF